MPNDTPLKTCSKCHKEFPCTEEFFRFDQGRFRNECRACATLASNEYYWQHREEVLEKKRLFRLEHLEEMRERDRLFRLEHLEEERQYDRQMRDKHQDTRRQYDRTYKAEHRDEHLEYARNYALEHPESRLANESRRRARIKSVGGSHTAEDVEIQIRMQTGKDGKLRCWWCAKVLANGFEIDHRIPIALGGSDNPENLCIACSHCNRSKGKKLPSEFNGRLL